MVLPPFFKCSQRITFFRVVQCVLYLLPLCLNRDFRGLSFGAAEGFLCQPPLTAQKLRIPPSVQPCWSSGFQRSERKKNVSERSSLYWFFFRLESQFLSRHPSRVKMLALGFTSRCPAKRYGSICLSVKIIITAKANIAPYMGWSKAVLYILTALWKCWDI